MRLASQLPSRAPTPCPHKLHQPLCQCDGAHVAYHLALGAMEFVDVRGLHSPDEADWVTMLKRGRLGTKVGLVFFELDNQMGRLVPYPPKTIF